ncbi:antibiotic biosynthesis monooxygenase [Pontibacterium granulatum]|uniref:antibiotic biosynthesis monooxygenase n=1 Tax=Pontibacterium granulatum TaxID=2036029 RepID=UPI00249AF229|nr:antibiotic biosynthesis monooxygenase [Pontibacterium granulatum]MDI3326245.1 antibiotic biosynthesis monooxygenase [Pontibacterium granulatum]
MMSSEQGVSGTTPVTVVISRRVKNGCEEAFEHLSNKMTEAAAPFPGYMGTNMFRPSTDADPEYRIIFKFRSQEDLQNWQDSSERAEWLKGIECLLETPSQIEVTSGLVTWFSMPGQNPVQPPPKYKMTCVSWLALCPTVTLIFWLFGDLLAQLPLVPRSILVTAVVMVLMSYVLMPRFSRWFAFWLFPKEKRDIR